MRRRSATAVFERELERLLAEPGRMAGRSGSPAAFAAPPGRRGRRAAGPPPRGDAHGVRVGKRDEPDPGGVLEAAFAGPRGRLGARLRVAPSHRFAALPRAGHPPEPSGKAPTQGGGGRPPKAIIPSSAELLPAAWASASLRSGLPRTPCARPPRVRRGMAGHRRRDGVREQARLVADLSGRRPLMPRSPGPARDHAALDLRRPAGDRAARAGPGGAAPGRPLNASPEFTGASGPSSLAPGSAVRPTGPRSRAGHRGRRGRRPARGEQLGGAAPERPAAWASPRRRATSRRPYGLLRGQAREVVEHAADHPIFSLVTLVVSVRISTRRRHADPSSCCGDLHVLEQHLAGRPAAEHGFLPNLDPRPAHVGHGTEMPRWGRAASGSVARPGRSSRRHAGSRSRSCAPRPRSDRPPGEPSCEARPGRARLGLGEALAGEESAGGDLGRDASLIAFDARPSSAFHRLNRQEIARQRQPVVAEAPPLPAWPAATGRGRRTRPASAGHPAARPHGGEPRPRVAVRGHPWWRLSARRAARWPAGRQSRPRCRSDPSCALVNESHSRSSLSPWTPRSTAERAAGVLREGSAAIASRIRASAPP